MTSFSILNPNILTLPYFYTGRAYNLASSYSTTGFRGTSGRHAVNGTICGFQDPTAKAQQALRAGIPRRRHYGAAEPFLVRARADKDELTMQMQKHWDVDEPLDLRHYWNVINRKKWAILGLAVAVGLLAALIAFAMTPIYRASATILIESQQANVVSIEEVYGLDTHVYAKDGAAVQGDFLFARLTEAQNPND